MRISDWSSDVCSSDLLLRLALCRGRAGGRLGRDSGAGHRRGRPAEPAAVPRLCAAVLQSSAHCRLHETAPLVRGSLRRRLRRRGAEDPDSEAELDRIVVRWNRAAVPSANDPNYFKRLEQIPGVDESALLIGRESCMERGWKYV